MNLFKEFYPTPKALLKRIMEDFAIKIQNYQTFLEPSAGKGDIVGFIKDEMRYHRDPDIDCIELSGELRSVLTGKGERVVYDDFLNYHTFKQYDLILMNPPFSNGDEHLLKALELADSGGDVICILNAETIQNPCTRRRKKLIVKLRERKAKCKLYHAAFSTAERSTDVTVIAVYVSIPKKETESELLKNLKQKHYAEFKEKKSTAVAFSDSIKNAIIQYNLDIEAGIQFLKEYAALKETFRPSFFNDFGKIIELKGATTVNEYVKNVRNKYWSALFQNPDFTKNMTSDLSETYTSMMRELVNYDFNEYNIRELKIDITKHLVEGVESCIIRLFDELTAKHSWYPECDRNIHYYNGWASNKAWIINEKVVMPYDAFRHSYFSNTKELDYDYRFRDKLLDIEKALTYLDTKGTDPVNMHSVFERAKDAGITKDIQLKYFTITVYKKGTCHIRFKDLDLLKKLNIYGCQHKGWLPPAYGKKQYDAMSEEEKEVIDSFEGKESYEDTFRRKDYFLNGVELNGIEKVG